MQLLLVEDDQEIRAFLRHALTEAGYQVDAAPDAKTAEQIALERRHDVLIVDLGLPDQDGMALILRLRQMGVNSPVLILSARRGGDDRVRGLEQGGDDYLTKPFALAELLARGGSLLKRHVAPVGGTRQEFTLLEYLCRNPGRVVTRSMILDKVWGLRIQPATNVVDAHIYRLRGKGDAEGMPPLIR